MLRNSAHIVREIFHLEASSRKIKVEKILSNREIRWIFMLSMLLGMGTIDATIKLGLRK